MEAISALSITLDVPSTIEVMKKHLSLLISQATKINVFDCSEEQGVLDNTIEQTVESIDKLDEAIKNLNVKINNAIKNYVPNPAGEDVTAFYIFNNGFDEDINFESDNSNATEANKTYLTFGWTPSVSSNSTAATIEYGYEGVINGKENVKAPANDDNGVADGGALVMCVGWSGSVTYQNIPVTLKAGVYTISYKTYNGNIKNVEALIATSLVGFAPTTGDPYICNENITYKNQVWEEHSYSFELANETEGRFQIGMKPINNTNSYNAPELFVDEISVRYSSPVVAAKETLEEIINEATLIVTSKTNVGSGAFQIPLSAVETLNTAIEQAQEDCNNSTVLAEFESATETLNKAIEAYKNAELNAPESGKLYSIINNSDGYNYKGYAVTFKSASNADLTGNTTKMGYTELPGSAYPQGITFTAVPETLNGYILSYTREDGNTVYVGTGISTGLGGANQSHDQIRPTTDPAKAVTIQIIPTATEGIWNLKNILANKNIGANGAGDQGFYTVNTYTSMTLAEVTPLTVTVSNDAAESKFKTLILPFDAELPEGVTAYSCEEVVNSVLNTVAAPSIEANTPYILSVEAGKSVEFTGVGGAYTDASYTAGYLTGGYTTGTVPAGSYVLQTQEGVQGFYKVAETEVNYVPYRAYLTVPSANAKAFFFGGDATAINGVEGAEGATEVVRFNAAGVQVAAPVKGLNIVKMSDGTVKKVMVK